ncbi:hypothetical protein Leucomu_05650 [Leucobacter muris]|uniref:Uncharacterized protein n=1 Tax=Leucobacter muris TaxID=1935379 RepID=A0ABX5QEH9_9MICO|nr:hypothetical protein [Leucobacter muris]QAB17472.1 hypothetical protein Leucomu_05650 [Leucobacter muris]
MTHQLIDAATMLAEGGTVAVIARRQRKAQEVAAELVKLCPQDGLKRIHTNGNEHYRFPNGARVLLGSGKGIWLRGVTLDFLIIDVAAQDDPDHWRPCFAGREPRIKIYRGPRERTQHGNTSAQRERAPQA